MGRAQAKPIGKVIVILRDFTLQAHTDDGPAHPT